MLNKKIVFGLLCVVSGLNVSVVAGNMQVSQYDVRDENGRTDLMNFVIGQENNVERLESCISYYTSRGYADCVEYYAKQLRDVKYSTGSKIVNLMRSGANFNAQDNDGNTALSFAQTREMYNILRENGAEFQFGAWMYIYRAELAVASIVTVGAVVYLNQEGVLTADTVSAFGKDAYAAMALVAVEMQAQAAKLGKKACMLVEKNAENLIALSKSVTDFIAENTPVVQDALANSMQYAGDSFEAGCVAMNKSFSQAFPRFDADSFELGFYAGALYVYAAVAVIIADEAKLENQRLYYNN